MTTNITNNLFTLLTALSDELNLVDSSKWSIRIPENFTHGGYLVAGSGMEIFVCVESYGLKSRPSDKAGEFYEVYINNSRLADPLIYVSKNKSPALIAKDIVHRLLLDSQIVHKLVIDAIDSREENSNKAYSLYSDVCEECDVQIASMKNFETSHSVDLFNGLSTQFATYGYGDVSNFSARSADISLKSVPAELLPKLLRDIRESIKNFAAGQY